MNITDIDDKIIKRARQNYLYEKYVAENHSLDEVLTDVKSMISAIKNTIKTTTDNDKKSMFEKMVFRVQSSIENIENAATSNDEDKINELQKAINHI